jgi:hypothetical protein
MSGLWPKLAKSSCGWSTLWLHREIQPGGGGKKKKKKPIELVWKNIN